MADYYSCDIQTEGAVSVELHGGNNETHNQVLQGISPQNSDNERTNPPSQLNATPLHQTGLPRLINTDNEANPNEFDQDAMDLNEAGEEEEEGTVGHRSNKSRTSFIMKNGCCRECMKAFSRTGKVSDISSRHFRACACGKNLETLNRMTSFMGLPSKQSSTLKRSGLEQ